MHLSFFPTDEGEYFRRRGKPSSEESIPERSFTGEDMINFSLNKSKARKFLRLGLVSELSTNEYQVLPLPNCHLTHIVKRQPMLWECSCQAKSNNCSHIWAVRLGLLQNRFMQELLK